MKDKDNLKCAYAEPRIKEIIEENKRLSDEVKRLVKTEYSLYNTQIYLDNQIELYKALHCIGKKLTNITDINILFNEMATFILEKLNYGTFVLFEKKGRLYRILDKGGKFDKSPNEIQTEYQLEYINGILENLKFNDDNYALCEYSEFGKCLGMKSFVVFVLDAITKDDINYLLFVGNPEEDEFFSQIDDTDMVIVGLCNLVSFVKNSMNNIYHYQELVIERESLERKVNERTKDLNNALEELQRLNSKLHFASLNDELTGLYNRRGFFSVGSKEFEDAQKNKTPLLLVYCDLDGLKKINDTYGHKEGDFAIKQTGILLTKIFRKNDIVSRYGGDEYVALLSNTTEDYISQLKKRINYYFDAFNNNSGKVYKLSISVGFSILDFNKYNSYTFEELIDKADKRLYIEKIEKNFKRGEQNEVKGQENDMSFFSVDVL